MVTLLLKKPILRQEKSYQPRKNFNWSHPIVYFAGKKIGWSYLSEKDSKETFEAFKRVFNSLKNNQKMVLNLK